MPGSCCRTPGQINCRAVLGVFIGRSELDIGIGIFNHVIIIAVF